MISECLAVKVTKKLLVRASAIFTIATISACADSSPPAVNKSGLVDVAEITHNIESYIGQTVLVRNDVIQTIGERGSILDKDRAFSGETIIVIDTAKVPLELAEENTPEVLVKGEVKRLTLADIQQQYNITLNSNIYSKYENQPAIIAESLTLSPDPEDLTQNLEAYYVQPLAIKGELEDLKSYGVLKSMKNKLLVAKI